MSKPIFLACLFCCVAPTSADWKHIYTQSFDQVQPGTKTASPALSEWEGGSASGVVFDGKTKAVGKFLVASSAWTSFNQGPIFNLDLTAVPHDRVRVSFDLYTFGEWRGVQAKTGGPQHRLMFFDSKAKPRFSFDTCFATNPAFQQAWPERNPAKNKGGNGAEPLQVDLTGRFPSAQRWKVHFEYPSDSSSLRFTILCGAAAGSGHPMPPFGIDHVKVSVRSTAAEIHPLDDPETIRLAAANPPENRGVPIDFSLTKPGRVSIGVFDQQTNRLMRTLLSGERLEAGKHRLFWDGLDSRGHSVPKGQYEWRVVTSPGLTARYITTIGVNPPGGENPIPSKSWVGDHLGAGIVDVDSTGVYIGSPATEGGRMILKANSGMSKVLWSRPQFYQSGRLTKIATNGHHVFMIHPNGKLRRLNQQTGQVEREWNCKLDSEAPSDIDAHGQNLVVVYPEKNSIRWLSPTNGQTLAEATLQDVGSVAVVSDQNKGETLVSAGPNIFRLVPGAKPQQVATLSGTITAMDYDAARKELWAVVNAHQVVRLDANFRVAQTYSDQPRAWGPYDPTRFAGVNDIAADLQGGFFIGEPGRAPRRIAHISRDGSVLGEWFGGMSFYIQGSFDPDDPSRLIGLAPEGSINVYKIDFEKGTWTIEACYQTGRLGDSLFPFTGSFRAVRRGGKLYLYHREIPSVIRLDPELRKAIPVAFAGTVRNKGRSLIQFAGTGRDGYPKPWVAAAEHHGYRDLSKAPKYCSWADTDGDGEFDPQEFRFYPNVKESLRGGGDFLPNGDYLCKEGLNKPNAMIRIPLAGWEGPHNDAPRWAIDKQQSVGKIIADSHGFGSVRHVCVAENGSITATYQAGVMIRGHGQYEGGGWPESAVKGCRILRFDAQFQPRFSVGRQSKSAEEANSGVLYYPMQASNGPNHSVIINDQTKQPAQVWTDDGLYIGGVFDHRTEDGLPDAFYQVHGDDNQGCTLVTTRNGKTYWLMPYQGHNRLYEITGWDTWDRQSGAVVLPETVGQPENNGTGVTARYFQGTQVVHEGVEPPIYFEKFGPERHQGKVAPHYKAAWEGFLVPPLTDRYQFRTLLEKNEQVAIWIDGRVIHSTGFQQTIHQPVDLQAGHRHRIRIEYINPDGRAGLKVLWSSRVLDWSRLPARILHPSRE